MVQGSELGPALAGVDRWTASEAHLAEMRVRKLTRPSAAPAAADALAGLVAGTVTGGLAGPVGAIVGAFVGGAIGLGTSVALGAFDEVARAHDERLDRDIGVIDGDVGVGVTSLPE
jgi:hypothetical protein